MAIGHINKTPTKVMNSPEVKHAKMKVLVGKEEGWTDHVMRVIEIEPTGHTPYHQHEWPHINYIIEGSGTLQIGDDITPVTAGSYAFVPPNTMHQFKNKGESTFRFICIVPDWGHH